MIGIQHRRLMIVATAGLALAIGTVQPAVADGTYVVRPHDTLAGIAATFGTTVGALESVNGLRDGDYIVPGQVLILPGNDAQETASGAPWRCHRAAWRSAPADDRRDRRSCATTAGEQRSFHTGQPSVVPSATAAPAEPVTATPIADEPAIGTPAPPTAPAAMGTPGSIATLLTAQAQAAGVDPALVKAVAWQESGWQMVTAADGGIGIMQLMPTTVTWVETSLLGHSIDPYSPTDNVRAGVAVLRYDLNVLSNERLAVAAYHQGLRSVQTSGISAATAQYVTSVLALQQQFAG